MQHKRVIWLHPKVHKSAALSMWITIESVAVIALLDNDKRFYSHDASVMSHWHDDDRIITIQPMVICFSWEKQVSVALKDVPTDHLFSSSPTTTPCAGGQ